MFRYVWWGQLGTKDCLSTIVKYNNKNIWIFALWRSCSVPEQVFAEAQTRITIIIGRSKIKRRTWTDLFTFGSLCRKVIGFEGQRENVSVCWRGWAAADCLSAAGLPVKLPAVRRSQNGGWNSSLLSVPRGLDRPSCFSPLFHLSHHSHLQQ